MKQSTSLKKLYKSHSDQLAKPTSLSWRVILLCLILTLIFGFLAGLGGGLVVLITRTFKIPFYKKFNLDEMLPKREITIKTREVISVAPDEQVEKLIRQTENQIVKIFAQKKGGKILEQIYRDEESLGQGFILTNDGWIVTHQNIISDSEKKYVISGSDKKIYPIEKTLLDPLTDVAFLKIKAKDLEVASLSELEDISLGQRVLILDENKIDIRILENWEIRKLKNEKKEMDNLIESTDKFSRFIQLNQGIEASFIGSPVINLKGSIIGIMNYESRRYANDSDESGIMEKEKLETKKMIKTVIPVTHFKPLINQVLKQGGNLEDGSYLHRPAMGVDYLDLAQVRGITDKRFKDLRRGALIWGSPVKDSAAEAAGLKNADVILKVNNDLVNSRHNLTGLIQEYKVGDKVELTILRDGKEEKVEVELETLNLKSKIKS